MSLLNEAIIVDDAYVEWNETLSPRYKEPWGDLDWWSFYDVEAFVNRIAVSSIKSLTYPLEWNAWYEKDSNEKFDTTIKFNCDERFPFSFMEFLETQPIYCGHKQNYLTLELA